MLQDRITLAVPAKGEYAKTVRMTAASLAARVGMSFADVEDVKNAVEEAFVYSVESLDESDEVKVVFSLREDGLDVDVSVGGGPESGDESAEISADLATLILNEFCESHGFVSEPSGERTLRMALRCGSADGD